jgi:ligand-binding sensor domain-containing protein/DNA-binding CsgD family transcriptional regulator
MSILLVCLAKTFPYISFIQTYQKFFGGALVTTDQEVFGCSYHRIHLFRLVSLDRLLLLLIILFQTNSLLGSIAPVRFNHITTKEGLSVNAVRSILEDSQGFMWFGTTFGLNRYDGSRVKVFLNDPLDETSIPGARISALCEDLSGVMWIGTEYEGMGRYNRDMENFENFAHDPDNPNSLVGNNVTCLLGDSRGGLWIGTENGLSRFLPATGEFLNFHHEPGNAASIAQDRITSLAETPGGRLWVGTENGAVSVIHLDDYSITQMFLARPFSSISASAMLADSMDECLWVGRIALGVYRWDYHTEEIEYIRDEDELVSPLDGISSISKGMDGTVWITGGDGLANYNPKNKEITYFKHDANEPGSIGDNLLYASLVDTKGVLWITSNSAGVSYYDPGLIRFRLEQNKPGDINSIRTNAVFSISEDHVGNIWFGTLKGGSSCMNPHTGIFTHYNSLETLGKTEWWTRDYIACITSDRHHRVWIGTFLCGIFRHEFQDQVFKQYRNIDNVPNSLSDKTVLDILETRLGDIWIATETQGLEKYDEKTDAFIHYPHDPENPQSLSNNSTLCLLEDRAGYIWVGTAGGGLNQFDRQKETFKHFKVVSNTSNSITSNTIQNLYEDESQTLWIGTRGGGLNRMNRERTRISTLDLHSRLMDLSISGILQDDDGFLWLSTNQGLMKAHPDTGLVNTYTPSDGIQESFYSQSCLKAKNGLMYFGGSSGYNVFHPDSIHNNPYIPAIVITSLSINYAEVSIGEIRNGRTILEKSITQTDKLNLSYRDKVVSFRFAALNYSASQKNHYSYMLEGYDAGWIDAHSTPWAQYMNLPAGDYTFRVMGSNNDGVWNLEGASIGLSISPPFWKTWWFNVITLVVLIGFIFIYIQLRLHRLKTQRTSLENLVRERTAALKEEIEERQRVEIEKNALKVDHLKRELLTQSLHLNEKQQIMDGLENELVDLRKMKPEQFRTKLNKLINFLRDRSSVKQGWEDFEIWFTEIHTGFYSELRNDFPQLTESELKVCALLRLNMISKDIAKIMNVQSSSVDIYRHRIRKKLEISSEENLSTFLSKY